MRDYGPGLAASRLQHAVVVDRGALARAGRSDSTGSNAVGSICWRLLFICPLSHSLPVWPAASGRGYGGAARTAGESDPCRSRHYSQTERPATASQSSPLKPCVEQGVWCRCWSIPLCFALEIEHIKEIAGRVSLAL